MRPRWSSRSRLAHALVFVPALLARAWSVDAAGSTATRARGLLDVVAFGLGIAAVVAIAATIVLAQGAGRAAYEDIVLQARALATDTLPEPNAPPGSIRWLTGNADPKGELPWPFGATDYLVWWGTGSWPVWLASVPALVYLVFGPGATRGDGWPPAGRSPPGSRSRLPGLYWQHYYLLPDPRRGDRRRRRAWPMRSPLCRRRSRRPRRRSGRRRDGRLDSRGRSGRPSSRRVLPGRRPRAS